MTEKAKVKGREKRREGKVISSFVVLAIVLSVSLASVAIVSALVGVPGEPEVTGITVSADPTSIPANDTSTSTITATVTWANQTNGDGFTIRFEITGDALGAAIGPEYVDTDASGVATATLAAGLTKGEVTVKASWVGNPSIYAETTVRIGLDVPRWDINEDCTVNYIDLAILSAHWGETTTSPYPRWDINEDGTGNYIDLAILSAHWGETTC